VYELLGRMRLFFLKFIVLDAEVAVCCVDDDGDGVGTTNNVSFLGSMTAS
jgi:hypothetical protein